MQVARLTMWGLLILIVSTRRTSLHDDIPPAIQVMFCSKCGNFNCPWGFLACRVVSRRYTYDQTYMKLQVHALLSYTIVVCLRWTNYDLLNIWGWEAKGAGVWRCARRFCEGARGLATLRFMYYITGINKNKIYNSLANRTFVWHGLVKVQRCKNSAGGAFVCLKI